MSTAPVTGHACGFGISMGQRCCVQGDDKEKSRALGGGLLYISEIAKILFLNVGPKRFLFCFLNYFL
jgi:hypothetical protein